LLLRRRAILESTVYRRVREGSEPDEGSVSLLVSINWGLGEGRKNVALFDETISNSRLLRTSQLLHTLLWSDLVEARRYSDALRWENTVRDLVLVGINLTATNADTTLAAPSTDTALKDGAMYFEALAGSGRSSDARELFERAVKVRPLVSTYVLFLRHATRSGDAALASWVHQQAASRLPADQMRDLDEVRMAPPPVL